MSFKFLTKHLQSPLARSQLPVTFRPWIPYAQSNQKMSTKTVLRQKSCLQYNINMKLLTPLIDNSIVTNIRR